MKQLAGLHPLQLRLSFILAAFRSFHLVCAANFRHYDGQIDTLSSQSITSQTIGIVEDKTNTSCAVANIGIDPAVTQKVNKTVPSGLSVPKGYSKLRVCNAATTKRTAVINVWLNGGKLNAQGIEQRECKEFLIPITQQNEFVVKLSGQVISTWSAVKSGDEMQSIPIMFLVAYVFGHGGSTIFTVNEFHGENNGLNSVQVAYMDIFRGAPDAKLQLISPDGSFQIEGGTFVHVCAGEYSLQFLRKGEDSPVSADTQLVATSGEQYVVMRLAPDGTSSYSSPEKAGETVIVFPASFAQSGLAVSWLLSLLLCVLVLWRV